MSHPPKFIPVTHWSKYYDWPSIPALRWLIFNSKTNGFDKVIRRVGGRILISIDAYYEWIEETNQKGYKQGGAR